MSGLYALRNIARKADTDDGQAFPADVVTDELAVELAESRARLDRELALSARTGGFVPPPRQPAAEPAPAALAGAEPIIRLRREGRQMTFAEQTRAAARQAWRQARRNIREMRNHPGGMINHWLAQAGPSVDDQSRYKREKRWVPLGHDDGVADKAGTAYHTVIGVPGVAFFGACKAIVARPFRFGSTFLACYLLTAFALLIPQSLRIAGVAMLVSLPIAVITALIGLEAWAAASRRAKQPRPADDDEDDEDDDDPAGYEPPSE